MLQFGYLMPAVEPLLYGCPSHNVVSIFASFQSFRLWTERRPAYVDSSLVVKANCKAALMYTWYYFRAMDKLAPVFGEDEMPTAVIIHYETATYIDLWLQNAFDS